MRRNACDRSPYLREEPRTPCPERRWLRPEEPGRRPGDGPRRMTSIRQVRMLAPFRPWGARPQQARDTGRLGMSRTADSPHRSRRPASTAWRIVLAAALLLLVAGAIWMWQPFGPAREPASAAAAPPAVPVVIGSVVARDVPIYLLGLGTVQAFNTVTVKVRVDGELQKVAFTEGQDVKAADLLAQIDPRPFQAQLEQAQAQKTRDEAQLANAKLDLARFTSL